MLLLLLCKPKDHAIRHMSATKQIAGALLELLALKPQKDGSN